MCAKLQVPGGTGSGRSGRSLALVRPLCHEVGNLLAAIRLSGHVLGSDLAPRDRTDTAQDVENLAAQAGALLAQVRPLLSASGASRIRVSTSELLDSVGRSVADRVPPDATFRMAKGRGLPDVRIDSDAVHNLLVALVLGALEDSAPSGRVRVAASQEGRRVLVSVHDDAPPLEPGHPRLESALRGRPLVVLVADAVLRQARGRATLVPGRRGNRVDLFLPAVTASGRKATRPSA